MGRSLPSSLTTKSETDRPGTAWPLLSRTTTSTSTASTRVANVGGCCGRSCAAAMAAIRTATRTSIELPDEHAPRAVALGECVQRVVDAAQRVGARDELAQFQFAVLIQID